MYSAFHAQLRTSQTADLRLRWHHKSKKDSKWKNVFADGEANIQKEGGQPGPDAWEDTNDLYFLIE